LLLLAAAITASLGNATPAIEDCYLRARELCERTGDEIELFRALFGLRFFYVIRGDLEKAYELAKSLLGLATTLNNTEFLLEAHVGLANSEFFAGDHQASQAQALKGIALYNRELRGGHALLYGLDPGVFCYARAGQTTWYLGHPDQALHYVEQAVALAEALQHPYSLGLAILNQTQILLHRGDKQAALVSAQRSKALAVEHGFSFFRAWALYFRAWALALNGDADASRAEIELTHRVERPHSAVADSYLGAFLAETYFALDDADSGLVCLAAPAVEHAYTTVRSYLKAEFTAMVAGTAVDTRKAETLYHEAITHSRELGVKANELRAATGLARLLMRRRNYSQAYEHLAPIAGWFQEGFDTSDLRNARNLLTILDNRLHRANPNARIPPPQGKEN
jgi:adenylate cyclase